MAPPSLRQRGARRRFALTLGRGSNPRCILDSMENESKTAVIAALAGNVALTALKSVAAAVTGSAAMLAETFHSLADTGNQLLLFLGMRVGQRPPDRRHPFGYGRAVYFWGFVVSIMLFTLGGAFSIWEGVRKTLHPFAHEGSATWAYGVLAGGFVFEAISLGISLHSLRKAKGRLSLRQYWIENRDSTLPTVVLEDTAAILSLGLAASGIWLSRQTENPFWDAGASAAIGVLLIAVAALLAAENYSLLIGEPAPRRTEAAIRRLVVEDDAVDRLVELRTMHIGPHQIVVALGVHFKTDLSVTEVERAIRRMEDRITDLLGDRTRPTLITVEPTRSGHAR
jgi:cation diffusion facilitator family transporter